MSDEPETPPAAPLLREATDAEDALIVGLSRAIGLKLLREWEDLPAVAKVLPMNRAFLSALALNMGQLLAAVAMNNPAALEGWQELVAQTLEIVKQTATEKRAAMLERAQHLRDGGWAETLPEKRGRTLVPEPKGVM